MARWPSPQDYREAIQNPSQCFSDQELRCSQTELDFLQLPVVHCGQYAAVFTLKAGYRKWAVRCFLHNYADRNERYQRITDFISGAKLDHMVPFQLIDRGIKVNNEWFPVLKMQFIEGSTLGQYIRANVDNQSAIKDLLTKFVDMMCLLKEGGVAHGDLQHDNILVSDGQLRLVDYDGMYVPSLANWNSHELGHRNYQHPERSERHFGSYLDNFSAWLIRTSLECLIAKPSLFSELNKNDDSLLLRYQDFMAPETSEAFWILEEQGGAIRDLSRRIRCLLRLPVEQITSIDQQQAADMNLPPIRRTLSPHETPQHSTPESGGSSNCSNILLEQPTYSLPSFASKDIPFDSVLSSFPKTFLFRTSSRSHFPYWQEIQRRTNLTFSSGEDELWTGGMNPVLRNSTVRFKTPSRPGLGLTSWVCVLNAAVLVSCLFPGLEVSNSREVRLAVMMSAVVLAILLIGWTRGVLGRSLEPQHEMYLLTNRSLKIIVRSGEELFDGPPPYMDWNVLLVSISLNEIVEAVFDPGHSEQVRLTIINAKAVTLHGFTDPERACFRIQLTKLGINCL